MCRTAEADFHVCPKQILTLATTWSRGRFPCLPKTVSHFGQSETWIRARSDSKIKYNNALEDHSLVINRQINTYLEQGGYNNNPGIFAKNLYLGCFRICEKTEGTLYTKYDPKKAIGTLTHPKSAHFGRGCRGCYSGYDNLSLSQSLILFVNLYHWDIN